MKRFGTITSVMGFFTLLITYPLPAALAHAGTVRSAIMNFKKGRNTIKPRTLRKLTKAIHALQNISLKR